jgi:hypothetical protein
MFTRFAEIGQYRQVVRAITDTAKFVGMSETNKPVFNHMAEMPVVTFKGTVKLHGCFDENTMITLANGEVIPISQIQSNTNILSYDFENDKQCIKKVTSVMKSNSDKQWCKLVFDDREIICTKDHKFWTDRGWIKAIDLNTEDTFKTDH